MKDRKRSIMVLDSAVIELDVVADQLQCYSLTVYLKCFGGLRSHDVKAFITVGLRG